MIADFINLIQDIESNWMKAANQFQQNQLGEINKPNYGMKFSLNAEWRLNECNPAMQEKKSETEFMKWMKIER